MSTHRGDMKQRKRPELMNEAVFWILRCDKNVSETASVLPPDLMAEFDNQLSIICKTRRINLSKLVRTKIHVAAGEYYIRIRVQRSHKIPRREKERSRAFARAVCDVLDAYFDLSDFQQLMIADSFQNLYQKHANSAQERYVGMSFPRSRGEARRQYFALYPALAMLRSVVEADLANTKPENIPALTLARQLLAAFEEANLELTYSQMVEILDAILAVAGEKTGNSLNYLKRAKKIGSSPIHWKKTYPLLPRDCLEIERQTVQEALDETNRRVNGG